MKTRRLLLSPAQLSAIHCRMDGPEQVDGLEVDGRHLIIRDAEAVSDALCAASNAEDAAAQEGRNDDAPFARRAAASLATVMMKVARLDRTHIEG